MLSRLKIRNKLLLILLGLIIPALFLTDILWINSMRPLLRQNIIRSQQRLTQSALVQISDFVNQKVQKLQLISADLALLSKDEKTASYQMKTLMEQDDSILETSFIDQDGNELIKLTPDKTYPKNELGNIADSQKFTTVTYRYGLEYIGQVYFQSEQPIVTIAIPVRFPVSSTGLEQIYALEPKLKDQDKNGVLGVLSAEVSLSKLFNAVADLKTGQDEYIYIIDEKNRIIAHPNLQLISKNAGDLKADIIKSHQEIDEKFIKEQGSHPAELFTTNEGSSEQKVKVLATHQHIPSLFWAVVVEQPVDQAFAALTQVERFAIFLFIAGVVAAILISLYSSNSFTHPIKLLQEGAEILGRGQLDYQLKISTGDEIEKLSQSFNNMAANLKAAFSKLQQDKNIISSERNKLAVVLSGISDAVVAVDLQRKVILFNRAAEVLTGYKEEEIMGQEIDQMIRVFDKEGEINFATYCPINHDHHNRYEGVVFTKEGLKMLGKGNKEVYVNLLSGHISEGGDINLGCIITMNDVSKEKELERMKLDFVTMAVHELRTPLTNIKNYLSVLRNSVKDLLNPNQQKLLTRVDISSQELGGLVENLLSVSNIERSLITLHLESVEWPALVKQIVDLFNEIAKEKGINLQFIEPFSPIPNVMADKLRIPEVLSNLISNALNFTQKGGEVTVWISRENNLVTTHIKDTGMGIPKDALPHLFTKFFRITGPLQAGSKGTGLGLYIAKSIIDMHKGKIWVESEEGKGSTFSFSLNTV